MENLLSEYRSKKICQHIRSTCRCKRYRLYTGEKRDVR